MIYRDLVDEDKVDSVKKGAGMSLSLRPYFQMCRPTTGRSW